MSIDVTIEDIASFAGVSISTVSRVLNDHPDVSAKTRKRVQEVIEKYGYVPNNSARNLKRESMHAIGIIVKGFTNPFFTPMIEAIQAECTRRKYTVILHPVAPDDDEIDSAISLNKEKKPEGMIFLGGNFQHSREKLSMLNIPYVMVTMTMHKLVDRESFSSITIDDYEEGYRLGRRFLAAGHSRIAAIGYSADDRSISKLRLAGLEKALMDHGGGEAVLYLDYAGAFSMEGGYEAATRLMRSHQFTCLFCVSDTIALGSMRAVHDAGFSVPGDISLVGFDGIMAAHFAIPSLATVRQPSLKMANDSIRMLLGTIEYEAAHQHRVLEAEFVEGESFRALL